MAVTIYTVCTLALINPNGRTISINQINQSSCEQKKRRELLCRQQIIPEADKKDWSIWIWLYMKRDAKPVEPVKQGVMVAIYDAGDSDLFGRVNILRRIIYQKGLGRIQSEFS